VTTADRTPRRPCRLSAWLAWLVVASVPAVATLMWFFRRSALQSGLPCQTQGLYDCGYDADLAAVYGTIVGLAFAAAVGAAFFLSRRLPRLGAALAGTGVVIWAIVATNLIRATLT